MKTYLGLLRHTLEHGVQRGDRTGTGTTSVFGYQMRFNLQDGFPLVTTKKIHLKSIIHELLWFLKGDTNVKYLQDNGVKIWDAWADEKGDLNKVYGHQWIRWDSNNIVKIKPRTIKDFGQITCVRGDALLEGRIKDLYAPTIAGVGYLGEYNVTTKLDRQLKKTWQHMLDRCYNLACKEYKHYGAKGIKVKSEWLNFSTFRMDVEKLPNWHLKKKNPSLYQLDKDYFGSNGYSKETCIWLHKNDSSMYSSSTPFLAISPDGDEQVGISQSRFASKFHLERSKISAVLRGDRAHHKKWKFSALTDGLYRYQLPINQIQKIIDLIKNNPSSRRIILNAWNATDVDQMALPPCHLLAQFYVHDGKLSCQLYQRSADLFLGVPFNIASYSLLLMMIAQVCDLQPYEFVHTFGDAHLYLNHISVAKEQLKRDPRPLPKMTLNPMIKNIFDFKYDDFKLTNYDPHPRIKAQISV